MIRCLVCVGTSSFDCLIKQIDDISRDDIYFFIQYGNSSYIPKNHESVDWVDSFEKLTNEFDIIVTHAGAGSVYMMLEKKLNIIVVPNLERVDKHQSELAHFVQVNGFGKVCNTLSNLETDILNGIKNKEIRKTYVKDPFLKAKNILEVINR